MLDLKTWQWLAVWLAISAVVALIQVLRGAAINNAIEIAYLAIDALLIGCIPVIAGLVAAILTTEPKENL